MTQIHSLGWELPHILGASSQNPEKSRHRAIIIIKRKHYFNNIQCLIFALIRKQLRHKFESIPCYDIFSFLCVCFFFRAMHIAYGSSQARGRIRAIAASLYHSHNKAGSELHHGNARSLAHGVRPGIKLTSSWILVWLNTPEPQWELPVRTFSILSSLEDRANLSPPISCSVMFSQPKVRGNKFYK